MLSVFVDNLVFFTSKTFFSFRTLVPPSPPQGHYEAHGAQWEWKPLVCPALSALRPVALFRDAQAPVYRLHWTNVSFRFQ